MPKDPCSLTRDTHPPAKHTAKRWKQRYLIFMSAPFVVWVLAFNYLPIFGWVMAFQDFKLKKGLMESFLTAPFVGLKHFELLWQDFLAQGRFYFALRNTLAMSLLSLAFGFAIPIIFALMLNEIRAVRFRKVTQTISYLPHFISWVVAAGMISTLLSTEGPVNDLLLSLGLTEKRIPFLADGTLFWGITVVSEIWKELGWNAIIFLAAIAGVDPGLYGSAAIDGAGRLKRIWHITLPCILPVIIVILIMDVGWLISIGFEKQYLLGSDITRNYSEVLDVYVLKYGIGQSRYSFGTAIGIFKSLVSFLLVLMANFLAKRRGPNQHHIGGVDMIANRKSRFSAFLHEPPGDKSLFPPATSFKPSEWGQAWNIWDNQPPDTDFSILMNECYDLTAQYLPIVCYAAPAEFDAKWDEFMQRLKDTGVDKLGELGTEVLKNNFFTVWAEEEEE